MSESKVLPTPSTLQVAMRFVGELQAGRRPSIEAALDSVPMAEWDGLLQSLLIAEVNHRRSRGETPVAREYSPRFPAHTSIVESVFANQLNVGRLEPVAPPVALLEPPSMPASVANGELNPPPLPPRAILLPMAEETLAPPDTPVVRRRGRGKRLLAVSVIIVALVAGVAYASTQFGRKFNNTGQQPPIAKTATTPSTPKGPSLFEKTPTPLDAEREFAEWIISIGGRGTLAMDNGGRRNFGPDQPIPKAKFVVTEIELPADSSNRWDTSDLARLRGRDKLTSVRLHHPKALGDIVLELLTSSPLRTLELHGNAMTVTGSAIARFSDLETLTIDHAPSFSNADMAAIGKLSKLKSLTLNAPKITPAGLGELKKTSIRFLTLGDKVELTADHVRNLQGLPLEEFESRTGMTDDAFLEFAIVQSLKRIRLQRAAITDDGLKAVLGLGMLEELQITGSSITGSGLENLSERKGLKSLDLSGAKIDDEGAGKLLLIPALRELRLARCPIGNRGVVLLVQVEGVELLDLSQTNVTDAALSTLRMHSTLKTLILTGTRVTPKAVADFERGTPNCKVIFGTTK